MPYSSTDELPEQAKDLTSKQKRAFMHAYNSAEGDTEARMRIAWSAAKGVKDVTKSGSYAPGMDDLTLEGTISKVDPDQRQAFGWASVTELNGEEVVDLQGDTMTTDELEKAAYNYVLDSRVGGAMHERLSKDAPRQIGTLIESMVFTDEKIAKMGLPETTPRGWWIGFQVEKGPAGDEAWDKVKKGKYTSFSVHGVGKRKKVSKGVMTRSAKEYEGWLERIARATGDKVTPEQLDDTLKNWMREQGVANPSDDDIHEFLMATYDKGHGDTLEKHLLGRHDQQDHDPTQEGQGQPKGHARNQHGTTKDPDRIEGGRRAAAAAGVLAPYVGWPMFASAVRGTSVFGRKNKQPVESDQPKLTDQDRESIDTWATNDDPSREAELYEALPRTGGGPTDGPSDEEIFALEAELARLDKRDHELAKALIAKAAERASNTEQFHAHLDELSKALESHEIVSPHFERLSKHLIGSHDQEDHDPTKSSDHSRGDHSKTSSAAQAGAGLAAVGGAAALATPQGRAAARMFGQRGAQAARYGGRRGGGPPAGGLPGGSFPGLPAGPARARGGLSDFMGGMRTPIQPMNPSQAWSAGQRIGNVPGQVAGAAQGVGQQAAGFGRQVGAAGAEAGRQAGRNYGVAQSRYPGTTLGLESLGIAGLYGGGTYGAIKGAEGVQNWVDERRKMRKSLTPRDVELLTKYLGKDPA